MTATPTSQKPNGEPGRKARPARSNPFVEKRAQQRQISRARSLSHVRVPIHTAFRAHHDQRRMPGWLRAAIGILVLLASVGLHVGFVVMAFGVGSLGAQREKERERLAIEMREHEAEKPKPPEPEKVPEPKKEVERVAVVKPVAPRSKSRPRSPTRSHRRASWASTSNPPSVKAMAMVRRSPWATRAWAKPTRSRSRKRTCPRSGRRRARNREADHGQSGATRIPSKGVTFTEAKYRGPSQTRLSPDAESARCRIGRRGPGLHRRHRQGHQREDPARIALPRIQRGRQEGRLGPGMGARHPQRRGHAVDQEVLLPLSNHGRMTMRKNILLASALALLGCGNRNFNRPDLLNEPRILAVQAEPPQPSVGTSTTLRALVYQPPGTSDGGACANANAAPTYAWSWCPLPTRRWHACKQARWRKAVIDLQVRPSQRGKRPNSTGGNPPDWLPGHDLSKRHTAMSLAASRGFQPHDCGLRRPLAHQ
jgi:hypothetical protein